MPEQPVLRVVDFNIRYDVLANTRKKSDPAPWAHRRQHVAALLLSLDADLIGMQEARQCQYVWLQGAMSGTYDTFGRQSTDLADGTDYLSSYCPVWWRRDRFTLEHQGMIWLNPEHVPGRAI